MQIIHAKADYVDQDGVCYNKKQLEDLGAYYKIIGKYCNTDNNVVHTLFTIKIIGYQQKLF